MSDCDSPSSLKSVKRKHNASSVGEKLKAIDRVSKGESQAKVARDIGIPESTLHSWIKNQAKLREFVHTIDGGDGLNRKRARLAKDKDLDAVLYKWFVQQQQSGVPLSGPIVCAQAEKFNQQLNGDSSDFKGSAGWLWRFCKRHGIGQIAISGWFICLFVCCLTAHQLNFGHLRANQ